VRCTSSRRRWAIRSFGPGSIDSINPMRLSGAPGRVPREG
jgi:hypothetical protein